MYAYTQYVVNVHVCVLCILCHIVLCVRTCKTCTHTCVVLSLHFCYVYFIMWYVCCEFTRWLRDMCTCRRGHWGSSHVRRRGGFPGPQCTPAKSHTWETFLPKNTKSCFLEMVESMDVERKSTLRSWNSTKIGRRSTKHTA